MRKELFHWEPWEGAQQGSEGRLLLAAAPAVASLLREQLFPKPPPWVCCDGSGRRSCSQGCSPALQLHSGICFKATQLNKPKQQPKSQTQTLENASWGENGRRVWSVLVDPTGAEQCWSILLDLGTSEAAAAALLPSQSWGWLWGWAQGRLLLGAGGGGG